MTLRTEPFLIPLILFTCLVSTAQKQKSYDAIHSGIPWFDNKRNVVSAHGGCIIKDGSKYYLFGEKHSDTNNAFAGFNCYSSADLYNWKFESIALPPQPSGKLGPNRVGERVKVMKCAKTGEYILYMHADTLGYKDQFVGYATSTNVTGPYIFRGPLWFQGKQIRKWDMGTFQDKDGSGYILLHGADIYKLSDDYKSVTEQVCKSFERELEAPAIFRKDSIYYFLGSHLSSWEKNDNYYYTASSLKGPWIPRGVFAPEGSLTWYSQTTFVLPIVGSKETTYMFMGDRWSYPKQLSAATYVWQPLIVSGMSLSIPQYQEAWQIDLATGVTSTTTAGKKTIESTNKQAIAYSGNWRNDTLSIMSSDKKSATFTVKFHGTQIGFYGMSRPDGGYAQIVLYNSKGNPMLSSMVDMYCKYPLRTLKFLSPVLPKDSYKLRVSVMGERGNWSDKRRTTYGSSGYFVSLDKVVIND